MAGGKLKIISKVAASTILEVVISMVVITAVFGIGMMIFTNVTRSSLSAKKVQGQAILQARLLIIEHDAAELEKTTDAGGFRIVQEVKQYADNEKLSDVHLAAYDDNNEIVAELEKIIIKP